MQNIQQKKFLVVKEKSFSFSLVSLLFFTMESANSFRGLLDTRWNGIHLKNGISYAVKIIDFFEYIRPYNQPLYPIQILFFVQI